MRPNGRSSPRLTRPWAGSYLFAFVSTVVTSVGAAEAHEAPSGWTYPKACCSEMDCRAVSAEAVKERPQGYIIALTGEIVPYSDDRLKDSPDGEYHWCSAGGSDSGRTICLFVPPQGY